LTRAGQLVAPLLLVLFLSSCGTDSGKPELQDVEIDWLGSNSSIGRLTEKRYWAPPDLAGREVFGRHPWVQSHGKRPYIWSHLSTTRIPVEILEPSGRTLALDGFPAPSPDGKPQQVEVRIDDVPIGSVQWAGPARHLIGVPESLIQPGQHTISLHYRYTADAPGGGRGSELRGMAWHAIELMGAESPDLAEGPSSTRQVGPSVWWQFAPLSTPVELALNGVSAAGETRVALWIDYGDGRWKELERISPGRNEAVVLRQMLEVREGEVARVGVAVLRGAVEWEGMSARIHDVPERRPVVMVTLDTTRRDALGSYATGVHTPRLDQLAASGLVFDQAYSPTPATGPAHATVLLSQDPSEHGVTTNGRPLPRVDGNNMVVQAKALGYETAAFVSLGTVAADLGFSQGFDHFDDRFDHDWWRFAAQVNEQALPWIDAHPQSEGQPPGFLWVHYSDPHRPYGTADEPGQRILLEFNGDLVDQADTLGLTASWPVTVQPGRNLLVLSAPTAFDDERKHWYILRDFAVSDPSTRISLGDGWETVRKFPRMRDRATLSIDSKHDEERTITLTLRVEDNPSESEARSRYAEEVSAVDEALGALLDRLESQGWLERGLVLVFSDHGEDLGENGHFGHIHHLGQTLTHIPMILWGDGLKKGRVDELVGLIDVAPTLWSQMGLPQSPGWKGIDAVLSQPGRRLYLETFTPEAERHLRGVIELPYFVWGEAGTDLPSLAVTDLSDTPPRTLDAGNLATEQLHRVTELEDAWVQWSVGQRPSGDLSPEVLERLRSLGYIQ